LKAWLVASYFSEFANNVSLNVKLSKFGLRREQFSNDCIKPIAKQLITRQQGSELGLTGQITGCYRDRGGGGTGRAVSLPLLLLGFIF